MDAFLADQPEEERSGTAIARVPLGRVRPRAAVLALLLGAAVAGRLVSGGMTNSPVIASTTLRMTPWTAMLDQATGILFVASYSRGGATFPPTHGFASAGSYSFAVNGNHANEDILSSGRAQNTLSMLDERGRLVRTVSIAGFPGGLAVDPGRSLLYVTGEDENTANVRDARTAALLHTIPVGTLPNALAVSSGTGRLFVVNGGDGTVSVVDTRDNRVLRTLDVPAATDDAAVAVDSRTARVFVAGSDSLSVLDAHRGALLKTIALEPHGVQSSASQPQSGSAALPAETSAAVDERAGRVYILSSGVLSVVDAGRDVVLRRIAVGSDATAVALDAHGGLLLLTRSGRPGADTRAGRLEVRNPLTDAVIRTISVGVAPIAVAVDERAGRVLVVDRGGDEAAADRLGWLPSGLRQRLPFVPVRSSRREPARVLVLRQTDLDK